MLKFISASVLLLLLQSYEGKSNSKSSDDNTPSAVVDDPRTPSQPVDNTSRIIHGHTLPPEPDPNINSATLLGVDVNHNDVRDDVERWIYMTYKNPIEIGLFMQSARAYQKVIEDPSKALQTKKYIDASSSCFYYWTDNDQYLEKKYEFIDPDQKLKQKQFNTMQRHFAYKRYDAMLSGGIYVVNKASINACEYDANGTYRK